MQPVKSSSTLLQMHSPSYYCSAYGVSGLTSLWYHRVEWVCDDSTPFACAKTIAGPDLDWFHHCIQIGHTPYKSVWPICSNLLLVHIIKGVMAACTKRFPSVTLEYLHETIACTNFRPFPQLMLQHFNLAIIGSSLQVPASCHPTLCMFPVTPVCITIY